MTGDHIFFIPAVLLVGLVIGAIIGRKMAAAEGAARREEIRRRKARQPASEQGATGSSVKPSDPT